MCAQITSCWVWGFTLLIPALGKERQAGLCELEDSLVHRVPGQSGQQQQQQHVLNNNKVLAVFHTV